MHKYPNTVLSQAKGQLASYEARIERGKYHHAGKFMPYTGLVRSAALTAYKKHANKAATSYADARARLHILEEDQYYA